jgi:hypothetical protein
MKAIQLTIALLVLALSTTAYAGVTPICYAARVSVTLPAEAAGHNLYMNLYSINGEGTRTHVVAILTQGHTTVEYAVRWPGTWEVDLTMPDGEIVASQIAIPNDGCWSATQAPLYVQTLAD